MRSCAPTSSSTVRTPSFAMIPRSSSAMKSMKFIDVLRLAAEAFSAVRDSASRCRPGRCRGCRLASSRSPLLTSGAVAKPNSSAPRTQAMATSRPVMSLPSVSSRTRVRKPVLVSASGAPRRGRAPTADPRCGSSFAARRLCRRRSRKSARRRAPALATPAAIVPTPASDTSLTEMRAVAVGVLQVVDQLRQVLDRIDVMMRRRRNQRHAGRGITGLGNPRINLFAGQMAALAGLCALRHLDLDLFRTRADRRSSRRSGRMPPA